MCWRSLLAILVALAPGCAPSADRQAAAMTPTHAATAERSLQTRRYDTNDRALIMQATIGVLQDLGFTIEETQAQYGVIVASKLAGSRIRAQVVLHAATEGQAISVRANFQRVGFAPGASIAHGDTIADPYIYQGFFEKLSQSVFLTAHEI